MENPTIDQIRAMSPEDRAALNRSTSLKIVRNMLALVFIKAATPRLLGVLARGIAHNVR
jgi:hypothetical protein